MRPTRRRAALLFALLLAGSITKSASAADERKPIALHPDNRHYFEFRGKPTVLITSGEHYGAVLNADFDYLPYLDELKSHDLNLTRTFSGVYREVPGSFNIRGNTLAPKEGRYVSPWVRAGDKYDVTQWNDDYFRRLKDFVAQAGERGVVVELVLFCTFYEDRLWDICPLNQKNNVNGVGKVDREKVHTLTERPLVDAQLAFVRKVVTEMRDFDNLYYEVCNEPYFAGVADDWQRLVAKTVTETEQTFPHRHLVARNIANGSARVNDPDPNVSIFNFHYSHPPESVAQNYPFDRVISYDETGFRGSGDAVYRTHGWQFLLAGGAVYDNLDYSFTSDAENGSMKVTPPTPGGGGRELRRQLRTLHEFLDGFQLVRMKPDAKAFAVKANGVEVRVLSEPGRQYAAYFSRLTAEKGKDGKETGRFFDPAAGKSLLLELNLPGGSYAGEWVNPRTGERVPRRIDAGGTVTIETPAFEEDLALRLVSAGN